MADNKIDVGGRLHSIATGNVLAGANEILDDSKGKKQSEINTDVDNALANRYTKDETYNKNELNSLITTPNVQYVTVSTYSQLPATGSADTIYKVSSYDGTAVDATKYAEYAWDGSRYVLLSVKSAVDEIFDISVFNAESGIAKKYETLTAALTDIPSNRYRGGMSVKFIQSSDNKYIHYNLLANSFTTDVTQWAIADEGVYLENPEFVKVVTDNEDRILYAVKADGDIYFGAGVPQQVVDYVEGKIAELSLDEYEDIVTFLGNLINGDKTLIQLLNEKVDKEEGKSLIDLEFAEGVSQIENPEFAEVHTDTDDKVLYGVKQDGDFYFGAGVPSQVQEELDNKAEVAEVADLAENKVDKEEGKSLIDAEYASTKSTIDNPEFLEVTTDSEDKVLEGIQADGTKVIGADLNVGGSANISGDATVKGNVELTSESIQSVDNPEYLKVTTDVQGKILDGIKKDGSHYIHNVQSKSIDALNTRVDNTNTHVDEVDDKLHTLRKVSILGDSISTFDQDGFKINGFGMWYPKEEDRSSDVKSVEDTWWKQVLNNQGAIIEVNASSSGSTATNLSIGFSPRVPLLGNPDVIYIALGTNDSANNVPIGEFNYNAESYDLSQFAPAYIKGMKDTVARYPKAKIICVAFDMGAVYQNAIQKIANHYGAEYIYVGDISDVHPNKAEMHAVANVISCIFTALENNPEYIEAKTDSKGKLLAGRTPDGAAFENVGLSTPNVSIGGHLAENFEDPEGRREIKIDAERKILSFRDEEGILHEEVGIETSSIKTNSLQLSSEGMTEFQQALIDSGFSPKMPIDFSDKAEIHIPKPTSLPIVNLTLDNPITSSSDEVTGTLEFYDKSGNYFKKDIEAIGWQGNSTQAFPKKSFKFDFSDCTVKIGNWVPQDSFHLKAQYIDIFIGKPNIAYNYWRDIIEFGHDGIYTKPWLNKTKFSYYKGVSEFDEEVKLTPDGFPFVLYLNGDYYGVYTWNIKKAKENYAMKKTKTSNVHIDPEDIASMLKGLSIPWTDFELRNPKPKKKKDGWELTDINGNAYNPDAPFELIGTDSPNYDSTNTSHVKTAEVKRHIIDFKAICAEVITNNDKATFETYFDKDWFIDFVIWSNVVLDGDGMVRNTQYLYWGDKWYIAPYDCDQIFGCLWLGSFISRNWRAVDRTICGINQPNTIFSVFYTLYKTDIDTRYKVLRDAGILSVEYLYNKLAELVKTIGKEEYSKNFDKWPLTPCYREPNDNPQWKWMGDYFEGTPRAWNNVDTFNEGEYVYVTEPNGTQPYYYLCLETCQGVRPYTDAYLGDGVYNRPIFGGFFDSLTRTEMWLKARFTFLDGVFNYTQN